MVIIGLTELLGVLACLVGLVILVRRWKAIRDKEAKLLIAGLLVWTLIHAASNSLEWLRVTSVLDDFEDYFQILAPLLWGFFFYAYLMASEVANRKKSEARLRQSEERLTLAVEGARVGLWDWRIGTGELYLNEQWAKMVGYTLDELAPVDIDTWNRACHPDDLKESKRLLEEHFAGRTEYYECEIRLRHKDGRWIWVLTRGKAVERDNEGRAVRMSGTHQEITERREAEEAVKNEARRRRALMDTSKDAIAIIDQEHRIVEANTGFADMLGYTPDEVLGLRTWDWDASLTEGEVRAAFHDLTKICTTFETRHRRKDGTVIDVEVSAGGALVGNEPLVFTVSRNITKRKAMEQVLVTAKEQAEAANKAKTGFLANMSHEIRTPLNGILGMLQLLQDTEDSEQKEYALAAIQSAKRLTRLLSDILDLARVEAGKLVVYNHPLDLAETVRQVCELFEPAFRQSGVRLHFHIDPRIPGVLLGDAVRLQQVLNNLVGNALKFTDEGRVTVEVYPLPAKSPGQHRVLFAVTDTGLGISEDNLRTVFDAFTQADVGLARPHQGAGLGLAISQQLVRLMGGEIFVESELGQGSSFQFCLDFQAAEPRTAMPGEAGEERAAVPSGLRILVAEDAPVNQLAMTRLLKKKGHRVRAVRSGEEALAWLGREDFDVVLMDIQMPGMDGLEATRAIRNGLAGKDRKDIPIIALTAYAMPGDRERFLDGGMDDYLPKPVEMDALADVLARVAGIPKK